LQEEVREALQESRRDPRKEHMHRGECATYTCRRKERGCEIDAKEESDKPRRVAMIERKPLSNCESSLVISWIGTRVERALIMNAYEPMVRWKVENP
jgi:hypothetical protein